MFSIHFQRTCDLHHHTLAVVGAQQLILRCAGRNQLNIKLLYKNNDKEESREKMRKRRKVTPFKDIFVSRKVTQQNF